MRHVDMLRYFDVPWCSVIVDIAYFLFNMEHPGTSK